MKKVIFPLSILLLLDNLFVAAQTIGSDSQGKEIFSFYKSNSGSLLSAATSSMKLNWTQYIAKGTQYYVDTVRPIYANGRYRSSDSLNFTWLSQQE